MLIHYIGTISAFLILETNPFIFPEMSFYLSCPRWQTWPESPEEEVAGEGHGEKACMYGRNHDRTTWIWWSQCCLASLEIIIWTWCSHFFVKHICYKVFWYSKVLATQLSKMCEVGFGVLKLFGDFFAPYDNFWKGLSENHCAYPAHTMCIYPV